MVVAVIRRLTPADVPVVVEFSLRAWAPAFKSFERVLGAEIYRQVYPDWLRSQAVAVAAVCGEESADVWVVEREGRAVGFVATVIAADRSSAEIDMIAVDPAHQRRGLGADLLEHALIRARAAGIPLLEIATAGDPSHAPARRAYERAGFTALPLVRFYRKL